MNALTQLKFKSYVDSGAYGYCSSVLNHNKLTYLHTHDYFEIFLVVKGHATHYINDKVKEIKEGTLVLLKPEDYHCIREPISDDFEIINLIFIEEVASRIAQSLGVQDRFEELKEIGFPGHIHLEYYEYKTIKTLLENLMYFTTENLIIHNASIIMCVSQIFYINAFKFVGYKEDIKPDWLNETVKEMYKPSNYRLGVQVMQKIANCSKEHLSRMTKKYFDMSPTEVVNNIRLEEAEIKIIYSTESIINIAEAVGFGNLSHFYKLFKGKYGMTPKQYREKYFNESDKKKEILLEICNKDN